MDLSRPTVSASSADPAGVLLARNVFVDYIAIGINVALGLLMLPFNLAYLGQSAYGLLVLTTSVTTYLSMLEFGYGSAQVKFTSQYRAVGDAKALNEITSTIFFLFSVIAVAMYGIAVALAFNIGEILRLGAGQETTARWLLLIVSAQIAVGLPFSVFGGITNGFQRYYLNTLISIATSLIAAAANVVVVLRGHGLVELVAVTTGIRIAALFAYRVNAYRVFPQLSIRWSHVRRVRLREVTAFSVFLFIIDIAQKINYTADTIVVGAFLGTAAVAVWAVADRLIHAVKTLSKAISHFLFPLLVEGAARQSAERLQLLLIHGTRLSLAMVVPMALILALVADSVVAAWVGPRFESSVTIVRLLAITVCIRIGASTAYTLLKGAGDHQFAAALTVSVAVTNLALSIVLVRQFGLVGIAVGTLIPVGISAVFVIIPRACRRAGLPLGVMARRAVWPVIWPALPTALVVFLVRTNLTGIPAILTASAIGALVYGALFLGLAVADGERQRYVRGAGEIFRKPRAAAAASS